MWHPWTRFVRVAARGRGGGGGAPSMHPAVANMMWEVVVGLEVHAQIASASKVFSAAGADAPSHAAPNSLVTVHDAGHPGTLPRPNAQCVHAAIAAGLVVGGRVTPVSHWERKHYFYPDLPAGYQVTQLDRPLVRRGAAWFDVPTQPHGHAAGRGGQAWRKQERGGGAGGAARSDGDGDGSAAAEVAASPVAVCRVDRIQLEVDAGKSVHTLSRGSTLVDLNRAGVGLLEVVTMPDLRSPEEAGALCRHLHASLRHVGVCRGELDQGDMRFDVNVSVRPVRPMLTHLLTRLAPLAIAAHGSAEGATQAPTDTVWGWWEGGDDGKGARASHWDARCPVLQAVEKWGEAEGSGWGKDEVMELGARLARAPAFLWPRVMMDWVVPYGVRVEMKNLNSIRSVERAIAYERDRQIEAYAAAMEQEARNKGFLVTTSWKDFDRGLVMPCWYEWHPRNGQAPQFLECEYMPSPVVGETRLYDAARGESVRARAKEGAVDYRFLPEPDLLPLFTTPRHVAAVQQTMPMLLSDVRERLMSVHGLSRYDANVIVGEPGAPAYYDAALATAWTHLGHTWSPHLAAHHVTSTPPPTPQPAEFGAVCKGVCNWMTSDLLGALRGLVGEGEGEAGLSASPVTPAQLGELVACVHRGDFSSKVGKEVLGLLMTAEHRGASPHALATARGWMQLNDVAAIRCLVQAAIVDAANAEALHKYRSGHERAAGVFVAKALAASAGRANPALVHAEVAAALGPCPKRK